MKKWGIRGVREEKSFAELRRFSYFPILFLVLFACFAVNSYSQDLAIISSNLTSGNTELKRNALYQIKLLRTEAASRMAIPALRDKEILVRATAATAVIFLPKSEAAQILIPLLNDKDPFVRGEAAFALGEVVDPAAVSPLIRSLQKDPADEVRSASAAALGRIGDPAAVEALTAILKKKPSTDNDANEYLRRSAARSIGQIAQIIRTGKRRVNTPQDFLPETYKDKKPDSDPATYSFPPFRVAMPMLAAVLSNQKESGDTRREAAFALGSIGDASSAAILRSYLNSPDIYLAEICKEALIKLGQPQ